MKILLISDLHGRVPEIKEDFDLIISPGDIIYIDEIRDIEFKNWKAIKMEGKQFHELMSKKKYIRIFTKVVNSQYKILNWLNKKGKTILVEGNATIEKNNDIKYIKAEPSNDAVKKYKNIKLLRNNTININGLNIIGFSGYRGFLSKFPEKTKDKKRATRDNKKWQARLAKAFSKKKTGFTIFLAHDPPRGTLDKIQNPKSPLNGKHIGDEYFTKYVMKYKPDLMICGHMHEYQGKKLLGKTLVINPGFGQKGQYAILNVENNKIKSLKFY